MTLKDLKKRIAEYQYFEDTNVIDVCLAGIVATRLKLGDPLWLVVIGASSGGKSQILRPLSLTDKKFIHRIDDLTENTFLSGMKVGKGQPEPSLLKRIGDRGIIVMSDLTVLFSKNKEARATILSQFRMIYDGEMTKFSGTSSEPLTWKGELGILAGSTPTIYSHFEEVADMGERFIYWRMKDYDAEKATRLAMGRSLYGAKLDETLSDMYGEYLKDTIKGWITAEKGPIDLPLPVRERILKVALFAERVRTTISMDFQKKEITKKPVPAFPMRVSLQLISLAKGLYVMRGGKLGPEDLKILDWCGYSLANEEKRGVLKILAGLPEDGSVSTQRIADVLGLSTPVTRNILQNMAAVGVVSRSGIGDSLHWKIQSPDDRRLVRDIEGIVEDTHHEERGVSGEEAEEAEVNADDVWNKSFISAK